MTRLLSVLAGWLLLGACFAASLPPPPNLNQRTGFDQRLGAQVPMDALLRDREGRDVTLAGLAQGKPTLLALGYYRCPNLCSLVLQGMARSVRQMPLKVGDDYQLVFLSIDPREGAADARHGADMLAQMGDASHVDRWHLLTAGQPSIRALADAVGFRYFFDARNQQYAHAAGVVVLTGHGKVAQYLFGVTYPPRTLRLSLVGASQGKLGNVIDQLVLLCCGYDPTTGRYSLLIGRVMQFLGIGFALVLLLGIAALGLRRRGQT